MRTCTISGPNFIFKLGLYCSEELQLRPQYLGLMRYRLPIQRGLEVASVSYNLSGGILDKKTKVEMVTLSRDGIQSICAHTIPIPQFTSPITSVLYRLYILAPSSSTPVLARPVRCIHGCTI
ncbi:hypothetical protein Ac2012v2_006891 [Leucoagaricus gongylophorus]